MAYPWKCVCSIHMELSALWSSLGCRKTVQVCTKLDKAIIGFLILLSVLSKVRAGKIPSSPAASRVQTQFSLSFPAEREINCTTRCFWSPLFVLCINNSSFITVLSLLYSSGDICMCGTLAVCVFIKSVSENVVWKFSAVDEYCYGCLTVAF